MPGAGGEAVAHRDLEIRHDAVVKTACFEATDFDSHGAFIDGCVRSLEGLDGVVFAVGLLGEQPEASRNAGQARHLVDVNLTSAVSLLAPVADFLEAQGHGFIIGLSSVAGERGRQSNYVYGAAKGGLSLFLQGLRNRLDRKRVRVYTIKLGFVDTGMTFGLKGLFLVAAPERIDRAVADCLRRRAGAYYLPGFWRWIMTIIRLIPEPIFKKMEL